METVLIVIHLMVVLVLIGLVLMQRSEGGALGIGGGSGGGGGLMSSRGAANALTRTTAILAVAFFVTTISLSIVAKVNTSPSGVLDRAAEESVAPSGSEGEGTKSKTILEQIQKQPDDGVPNN
jgi:preprotein translocase subunit SecG